MIIEKANTEYSTYRIPVLVMTAKGSLLACYECRKDYSDWAEIDLKIIKSTDAGETWRTLQVIRGNGKTLNNPVFIVKDDTVHFLYCENYKRVLYCKSTPLSENMLPWQIQSRIFSRIPTFFHSEYPSLLTAKPRKLWKWSPFSFRTEMQTRLSLSTANEHSLGLIKSSFPIRLPTAQVFPSSLEYTVAI